MRETRASIARMESSLEVQILRDCLALFEREIYLSFSHHALKAQNTDVEISYVVVWIDSLLDRHLEKQVRQFFEDLRNRLVNSFIYDLSVFDVI